MSALTSLACDTTSRHGFSERLYLFPMYIDLRNSYCSIKVQVGTQDGWYDALPAANNEWSPLQYAITSRIEVGRLVMGQPNE